MKTKLHNQFFVLFENNTLIISKLPKQMMNLSIYPNINVQEKKTFEEDDPNVFYKDL